MRIHKINITSYKYTLYMVPNEFVSRKKSKALKNKTIKPGILKQNITVDTSAVS